MLSANVNSVLFSLGYHRAVLSDVDLFIDAIWPWPMLLGTVSRYV